MKSNLSWRSPLTLLIVACSTLWISQANAQIRIEMPEIPAFQEDLGVIMDGTMFSSGSNMSIQMSMENGVKKIRATEDGVKTYIEEGENGILVKVTKQYGPEQMDILMEEHPDIYMSMKDFPTETEDADEIEVSVGITKKYEASSADELKEKHPEIHKRYEKYSNGNPGMQIFRGRFGDELLIPRLEIRPDFRGLDRGDIRIHDDEDKKEASDKEEDKDT